MNHNPKTDANGEIYAADGSAVHVTNQGAVLRFARRGSMSDAALEADEQAVSRGDDPYLNDTPAYCSADFLTPADLELLAKVDGVTPEAVREALSEQAAGEAVLARVARFKTYQALTAGSRANLKAVAAAAKGSDACTRREFLQIVTGGAQ